MNAEPPKSRFQMVINRGGPVMPDVRRRGDDRNEMASGIFINSGCLFGIAKQAYERAKADTEHDRSHKSNDPLISIVFAAAAAEAFINEIGELASHPTIPPPASGPEPDEVQNVASLLSEVEDAHGTTKLKFLLGKLALSGKTFDKGVDPYQDFAILIELRNSLIHLKFDRIESIKIDAVSVRHPSVIDKLRSKNVLAEFESGENTIASWLLRVATPAVARWACNATAGIVKDILASIPESELRGTVDILYSRNFAPIP